MDVSVLIISKNRRDELRRALSSVFAQTCSVEVLVIDDGSTDGTAEMLAQEFPAVRVRRSEQPRGYVVQRNAGMRLTQGDVVVSLDDDVVLPSPYTIEQTLRDFDEPRIGAVAIPCIDVGIRTVPRLRPPSHDGAYLTSEFTGGACAIRREVFEHVGGFRESFFHQGEERDFCVRLLAGGWVVRVGRADPIYHYPSLRRDVRRMDLYGRRNLILYAWHNEPLSSAVFRMFEMTALGLVLGVRVGRPIAAVQGVLLGYRACWQARGERRPLPRSVIKVFRRLWKHGPLPLAEIDSLLPVPGSTGSLSSNLGSATR